VVADDDAAFRQVLKAMLTGLADRIIEAADGTEALAAVTGNVVHLLLADLGMPGIDGHALLDRLPPDLPAIIITGRDEERPARAAALLNKDRLTRQQLEFAIRRASQEPR
jgi:CheY-like chemotaxis protein